MKFTRFFFTALCLCYALTNAVAFSPPRRPAATVLSVAFSPDGKLLASGGFDGRVKIWSAGSGKLVASLPRSSSAVGSVSFSPDGKSLVSVSWYRIRLWDTSDWKVSRVLDVHPYVSEVVFSPDGKFLASGGSDINIWDLASGEKIRSIEDRALDLAYTPEGRRIVAGTWEGEMKVWEVSTGKLLSDVKPDQTDLRSVAVSPDGRLVATGGWGDTANVWNLADWRKLFAVKMGDVEDLPVEFGPDSRTLAIGGAGGVIKLADISTGKVTRVIKSAKSGVECIAWSPDSKLIVAGLDNGRIGMWRADTGKLVRQWKAHKLAMW